MIHPNYHYQFQRAPTLGGECYGGEAARQGVVASPRFNGHPPLGVNATALCWGTGNTPQHNRFQRAPTLGGECYSPHTSWSIGAGISFNGHPPLGVNATHGSATLRYQSGTFQRAPTLGGECYTHRPRPDRAARLTVSTGTHPWG